MAEPVKSILFVDLDGLGRSLSTAGGPDMGERLSGRIHEWSDAIESGELIEPAGTPRTIAMRRCYVGPTSTEEAREAFQHAGFEIVDCDSQSQLGLSLAVDAMDAAADAGGTLDFILLTTADLTPLVERLRARSHHVVIFASEATDADTQAAADMVLPASEFVAFLDGSPPAPQEPVPVRSADRTRIEAFAREIHSATSIPMFSPKTFADLFRSLANEVTQNGYHFQQTAKTVAERLKDAGRNVTARQVVFVVKGLALKGHVFSNNDTAERLAEVFREQAHYLISGAGITLDDDREALLAAWIAAPPMLPAKPARASRPTADAKPVRAPQPATDDQPMPQAPSTAEDKPARKSAPARRPDRPAAAKPAGPPRLPERPKSAALPAKVVPAPEPPKPARSPDIRATIAARIAASAKMKPSARPPMGTDSPAPPPRKPDTTTEAEDAIESSILAAIAEAVDVLVEDGGGDKTASRSAPPDRGARQPPARGPQQDHPPEAEPAPPEEEHAEDGGGDIGDEIQRIVASYTRNRDDKGRS